NMNSISARRARMQRESRAASKPWDCCADDTSGSLRSFTSAVNPTELKEIEAGVAHSPESVSTEYPEPRRDEWETKILPVLKKIPIAALMRISGRSRSMLTRALAERSRPRKRNQQLLKSILQRLGMV